MKKLIFKRLILIVIILIGIASSAYLVIGAEDKTSKDKVIEKFNGSTKIKDKYDLDKNVLDKKINSPDDPKVKIGETDSTDFEPNLELSRWDGEVSFKVKPKDLDKVHKKDKDLVFDEDSIEFQTPEANFKFYEIGSTPADEGYEFEYILNYAPVSNVFEFDIEKTNLDFFKQLPLTAEYTTGWSDEFQAEITEVTETQVKVGANVVVTRPENVVNSYAVYHQTKKNNYTAVGGKNYMTGKAYHIYRIKTIDNNGDWIWCDQTITNIWQITCDSTWLANAVYPVIVDPTMGYTSIGASTSTLQANTIFGMLGTGEADTQVDSVHFYSKVGSGTRNFKPVIVEASGLTIVANGVGPAQAITVTSPDWQAVNYSSKPAISAVNYYICVTPENSFIISQYYDTGSGDNRLLDSSNSYATPTDPTDAAFSTIRPSIYATISSTGSPEETVGVLIE